MQDSTQAPAKLLDTPPRRLRVSTTERILAVAEKLLRSVGERFTLQEVAADARVSMSSIYTRYRSKDELIQAVQLRVLDAMRQQMAEGMGRIAVEGGGIEWAVSRIVDLYVDCHAQRSELIQTFRAASRNNHALHENGRNAFLFLSRQTAEIILRANKSPISDARLDRADWCIRLFLYALNGFLGFEHGLGAETKTAWASFKAASVRTIVNDISAD
jgi:AcrR family transcriptional regulator